jgi:phage terminase small subunit
MANRPGQGRKPRPAEPNRPGRPRCPTHIKEADPTAPAVWKRTCDSLPEVLAESDWASVEVFVIAVCTARRLLAQIGDAMTNGDGGRNPLLIELRQWLDAVSRYGAQLGLSPVARGGVLKNVTPPGSDRLETLLTT